MSARNLPSGGPFTIEDIGKMYAQAGGIGPMLREFEAAVRQTHSPLQVQSLHHFYEWAGNNARKAKWFDENIDTVEHLVAQNKKAEVLLTETAQRLEAKVAAAKAPDDPSNIFMYLGGLSVTVMTATPGVVRLEAIGWLLFGSFVVFMLHERGKYFRGSLIAMLTGIAATHSNAGEGRGAVTTVMFAVSMLIFWRVYDWWKRRAARPVTQAEEVKAHGD